MNIFNKLNNTMNIASKLNKILCFSEQIIDIEIDGFGVEIKINSLVTVKITKIDEDGNYNFNDNTVMFDNDKDDTEINLTSRFFYVECKNNIENFEKHGKTLFKILSEVKIQLSLLVDNMYQSEKAFLLNFKENK